MIDINIDSLNKESSPFDHWVIDNFLPEKTAIELGESFPSYNSELWHHYSNAIEEKKTLNTWNFFNESQYRIFAYLNSEQFVDKLSKLVGVKLYADNGLHGGGLHIHGKSGNLNPHLDYSLHPKLKLQRKINIIVYLEREYSEEFGGHLGLWHANEDYSKSTLVKEVAPLFNRAVIFDTTQNSWHGMSKPFIQKNDVYRKSIAVYYLCEPSADASPRERALFGPREEQKGDVDIENLINIRADKHLFKTAYKK